MEECPWEGEGQKTKAKTKTVYSVSHCKSQGFYNTLCLLTAILIVFVQVVAKLIRPPLKIAMQVHKPGCGSAETPGLALSILAVTVG